MRIWSWQHVSVNIHIFCCRVEPSLLLSSLPFLCSSKELAWQMFIHSRERFSSNCLNKWHLKVEFSVKKMWAAVLKRFKTLQWQSMNSQNVCYSKHALLISCSLTHSCWTQYLSDPVNDKCRLIVTNLGYFPEGNAQLMSVLTIYSAHDIFLHIHLNYHHQSPLLVSSLRSH